MGPVQFFNSLDSAKSATLTKLAGRCYCLLQLLDSTHSRQLKLDLDQNSAVKDSVGSRDSVFYVLDFNNLEGNYIAPDSAGSSLDLQSETPGIYIKARDSVLRSDIILRLLDYGVAAFHRTATAKKGRCGLRSDLCRRDIKAKTYAEFKKAMARCK